MGKWTVRWMGVAGKGMFAWGEGSEVDGEWLLVVGLHVERAVR